MSAKRGQLEVTGQKASEPIVRDVVDAWGRYEPPHDWNLRNALRWFLAAVDPLLAMLEVCPKINGDHMIVGDRARYELEFNELYERFMCVNRWVHHPENDCLLTKESRRELHHFIAMYRELHWKRELPEDWAKIIRDLRVPEIQVVRVRDAMRVLQDRYLDAAMEPHSRSLANTTQPWWPRQQDFLKAYPMSANKFRTIRKAAGVDHGLRGSSAQKYQYCPNQILLAVQNSDYRDKWDILKAWEDMIATLKERAK